MSVCGPLALNNAKGLKGAEDLPLREDRQPFCGDALVFYKHDLKVPVATTQHCSRCRLRLLFIGRDKQEEEHQHIESGSG